MIHQQRDTGSATRAHRQRDNHTAAARINPQTDASRATIASPFDSCQPARQGKHFRSRQFHSAQKW
jgi:hypothetical protein